MNSQRKSKELMKGVGIYAIGTFGTKILSFLIVPLYTYYITTSDMGVYDVIMSTISLLTPIVTMQISDATYRWIIREDVSDKETYIRATIQVLVVNCLIAVTIILVINHFYKIPYCIYFCIILFFSRAFQTIQKILRGLKKQLLFAVTGIVYTIVFLTFNVIQLCVLKMGVESLFQSAIIANVVAILTIIICEPKLRINYLKKTDIKLVLELYRFSVPLVPNYLNWWVINSSDRYIVLLALGNSANGILAIAHKFPSMLQALLNLFTSSWQDLSVADTEKNVGEYYTIVFRKYYRLALTILWGLIPATKIIIKLVMSSSYKSACDYVAFYYLGTVFQSFASFYGVGYLRSKRTSKAFSTSVYGAIVNAAVNICLIKIIGLQAAAFSTFIGFLVMWLVREYQNREELGIRINWKEFIFLTLCAVALCLISNYLDWLVNFALLFFGVIAFWAFNKDEIKLLIDLAIKRLKNNKSSQNVH